MKNNLVLVSPRVTEKSMKLVKTGTYMFNVARLANKHQIKEAVEKLFKVKVSNVKTVVKPGDKKRIGKTWNFKTLPDTKIAYIKVKTGKIELFPKS